jgi:glycosyltransferase involved in cell wall biosynthesis
MFSVIIPTFNRPAMLQAAIASVLAQEAATFDIIVVDDGSGSGGRVAQNFENPAITVLDNRKRGQARARNLAVAHARTPFIAFLDDDDEWSDPRHLARAAAALAGGADLWFAGGDLIEDGQALVPFMVAADAGSLERDNGILVSGVCYRRSLHERLGTFDETLQFYWDWDWCLRIARAKGRLARDPNRSVTIRRHPLLSG